MTTELRDTSLTPAVPLIWFIDGIAANRDTMGAARIGWVSRIVLVLTFIGMARLGRGHGHLVHQRLSDAMQTMPGQPRGASRLARALGLDGNPLRRASDRAEAWIRIGLLAVFLIAGPIASVAAGGWAYHAGITGARGTPRPPTTSKRLCPSRLWPPPTWTEPTRRGPGPGGRAPPPRLAPVRCLPRS